jgi:hypothetical protein
MRNSVIALLFALSLAPGLCLAQLGSPGSRGASAQTPAGKPVDGFALSLTTQKQTVHLGSPILVTVELRNVSGTVQDAMFGSRHYGYDFSVRNISTGKLVPANPNNSFGLDPFNGEGRGWPVSPNTSIYTPFRLDLLYSFTEPGACTVQVIRGQNVVNGKPVSLQSNEITITVLP